MKKLMKLMPMALIMGVLLFMAKPNKVYAHCEIPCGIYGDSLRIVMLTEDIQTIEKSMKKITALSSAQEVNYNQLVRWVNNKEEHANKIQAIATQYFMFQRVKLSDDPAKQAKNAKLLAKLHEICVYAMKAKQTTDLKYIDKLNEAVHEFSHLYFGDHQHH